MLKITQATQEHINPIIELWKKLMSIHKELDLVFFSSTDQFVDEYKFEIENSIDAHEKTIFIATDNDKLIGYVTVEIVRFSHLPYNLYPHCSIGDIMIEEEYRNHGIGKKILEEIKKWAKSYETYKIETNVFSKNKSAYTFFKSQGFEEQFHKLSIDFN